MEGGGGGGEESSDIPLKLCVTSKVYKFLENQSLIITAVNGLKLNPDRHRVYFILFNIMGRADIPKENPGTLL